MTTELEAMVESAPVPRAKIVRLEAEVMKLPQVEIPVANYFAKGVYARVITIPKGAIVVGRVHTQSQINVLLRGDHSVVTDQGVVRLKAPCIVVSKPGTKRAGYAHEETEWMTILGTELTDPEEIEETLTAGSFEEFELMMQRQLQGEK